MRAYVIFSSTEPVLVVTRLTIRSKAVLDELRRIGCLKFIAREVPIEHVRCQYGHQYDVIEEALERGSPLRVLDYNGRRIFRYLPFSDFGPAYRRELTSVLEHPAREPAAAGLQTDRGAISYARFDPGSEPTVRRSAGSPSIGRTEATEVIP